MPHRPRFILVACAALLSACLETSEPEPQLDLPTDAGPTEDLGAADAGLALEDTGTEPLDLGASDVGSTDAEPSDRGASDVGSNDAEPSDGASDDAGIASDLGPNDVGLEDSGPADLGAPDASDLGLSADIGVPDAGPVDAGRRGAAAWIRAELGPQATLTGTITRRTRVETPALVESVNACCSKYAFDVRETSAPDDRRVGFIDVDVSRLSSPDAYGGGISTRTNGITVFIAGARIAPGWPSWAGYSTTNYDGIVLDGAAGLYAEDLTLTDWNADTAIDNKAPTSQLVGLTVSGPGNRSLRYWRPGPHYLVGSTLTNPGTSGDGVLLWFNDCSTVELRVWDSTFNGRSTPAASDIRCNSGSNPTIQVLTVDPRTTGEMHPMFSY